MNSRAANGPLLVLMAIAFEADEKGECVLSVAELARKARLSDRAVQLAARELVGLGELEVDSRVADGRRNRYRLTLPDHGRTGEKSAPVKNLHPEESAPVPMIQCEKPQVKATGENSAPVTISNVLIGTNGRRVVKVKDVSEAAQATPERPDVDRLCDHLAARITGNGSRPPRITKKWRDAARLLIDADGMTEQQVHAAIDWSQDHEFWRANILSMPKLREKYDQLRQQARRPQKQQQNGNDNLGIVARYLERNGVSQ